MTLEASATCCAKLAIANPRATLGSDQEKQRCIGDLQREATRMRGRSISNTIGATTCESSDDQTWAAVIGRSGLDGSVSGATSMLGRPFVGRGTPDTLDEATSFRADRGCIRLIIE